MPIERYKSIILGFVQEYRVGCPEKNGVIDIHLAVSRDGETWERPFKDPLIENGKDVKAFDHGTIYTGNSFVVLPQLNELRLYYTGFEGNHGATKHITGIGLKKWQIDRMASATVISESATMVTNKHLAAGSTLVLNCQLTATSIMKIEININGKSCLKELNGPRDSTAINSKLKMNLEHDCKYEVNEKEFQVTVSIELLRASGSKLFNMWWE